MVHHLEMYSLRSVPIIALINFLVGAIVTHRGVFQLSASAPRPTRSTWPACWA
jgi:ABC-type transporter Mla maintaining outer membrane lipid asymmetry permease subunit MlaE